MESVIGDLLKTLIGLGPGGVIAALSYYNWQQERAERRELQGQYTKLLQSKIEGDNALATALEHMADKVGLTK